MRRLLLVFLLFASCLSSAPPKEPNDREWNQLMKEYAWIESLRKAQPVPPPTASRKQRIEATLENHRKLETVYVAFVDKVKASGLPSAAAPRASGASGSVAMSATTRPLAA